jgi:hypothetical protein
VTKNGEMKDGMVEESITGSKEEEGVIWKRRR